MIPDKPRRLDQILSRYGYCSRSEGAAWLRAFGIPRYKVEQFIANGYDLNEGT